MRYQEREAAGHLRPWVHCFWQLKGSIEASSGATVRGLPEGRADICYDLGDPTLTESGSTRDILVGTLSTGVVARLSGEIDLFGISFRPGAARPFFGVPLDELTDDQCSLRDHRAARPFALSERLAASQSFSSRVLLAEAVLMTDLASRAMPDPAIAFAVNRLRQCQGALSIPELCAETNMGERRLERRFRAEVGLAPKALARVLRFDAAKKLMRASSELPLTQVALTVGYYDQSHFNREFRRLVGVSPSRWRSEQRGVGIIQSPKEATP